MSDFTQIVEGNPFDEKLVGNVHPRDWQPPRPASRYNLVVIGGGTAGLVTAMGAAGLGARVALVERELLGGDCLNVGCVPSKGLIRAARAAAEVRRAGDFGVHVPDGTEVRFGELMDRMRRIRADISHNDSARRFQDAGVDVFFGPARFRSSDTIDVDGTELRFRKAVIATGARASAPPIPGIENVGYLTNETVFNLRELPPRLAVIGAGPIGCELAQAFRRFGSEVHLVEVLERVLSREDRDAAEVVARALVEDGIELACSHNIVGVEQRADGKVLDVECEGERREIVVDEILIGVGRAPNVEGLDLETVDVEYDTKTGVRVNDYLQTTNPRIYAAGDICTPYKFTHHSDFQARIVIQNALFFGRAKASALTIPWCTYTDPELAHVGLYEHEARERGIETRTFVQEFRDVDRALLDGETNGFVKILNRKGSDEILGGTIVARHAGEMISQITLAITNKIGLGKVQNTIHPYPTQAEAIRKIGDQWNRTRLTPTVKGLFDTWLRWSR